MSTVFLYPGQGSQKVSMGKELYDSYKIIKNVYHEAQDTTGIDICGLSFEGPESDLNKTQFTQPALLTLSVAISRMIKEKKGPKAELLAGHSLGEYSALVESGVLSFKDALTAVKKRGELMQEVGIKNPGTMAAVIGGDESEIKALIEEVGKDGILNIANLNSPGQIVISGEVRLIDKFIGAIQATGIKKCIKLPVSGAFHSPLMKDAAMEFTDVLNNITFESPAIPVIFNVTGESENNPQNIKKIMSKQITHTVRWMDCMEKVIAQGGTSGFEIGPGNVLKGLMRRIDRNICIESTDTEIQIEELFK